jgi:hypothetical protein
MTVGRTLVRLARLSLPAALAVVAVGCRYKPDLPPTAEVSGSVTLDGRPLNGAMIQFVPDAQKGTKGASGVAASDEKGHFHVTTAGVKGALVGSHKIRVEARAKPKNETDTMPASLIPAKYNDPGTSGLRTDVKADQKNVVDLPLKSKP